MTTTSELLPDLWLEAATTLGGQLCRDALWAGGRCNWLGDTMEFAEQSWQVVHRACGPDLYAGTAGIALFLARLYRACPERLFRVTALGGIRQALSRLEDIAPPARIAFYSGWTGIAYAALALGDEGLIEDALTLLRGQAESSGEESGTDVISGCAGAIPTLLQVARIHAQPSLRDFAVRLGDRLIEAAHRSDNGWSWQTLDIATRHDMTGFSHGASGIAWSLLELTHETGDSRFREAAIEGFRYERRWYSPEHENWPDFRLFPESPPGDDAPFSYPISWCYGAPGVGLSRLRAYELLGDPVYREEAEAAARTTTTMLRESVASGQSNYSLCHGLAGNADLLIYADQILGADHREALEQVGLHGVEQYQRTKTPWPGGVANAGETPSLMLGLAGTGYFYLRLFDPEANPSALIILPDR